MVSQLRSVGSKEIFGHTLHHFNMLHLNCLIILGSQCKDSVIDARPEDQGVKHSTGTEQAGPASQDTGIRSDSSGTLTRRGRKSVIDL